MPRYLVDVKEQPDGGGCGRLVLLLLFIVAMIAVCSHRG